LDCWTRVFLPFLSEPLPHTLPASAVLESELPALRFRPRQPHTAIMSDSWEDFDDDYEVPSFAGAAAKGAWDDEEDQVEAEQEKLNAPVQLTAAQVEANKKKAEEADRALERKMQTALLKDETSEERRLRERKQVEDADSALAGELFSATEPAKASSLGSQSASKGLGLALKTKQDHTAFGQLAASRLGESSTFNVGAFYKALNKSLESKEVSAETMEEIMADMRKTLDGKAKAKKVVPAKQSKKQVAAVVQKHNDKWGGSEYVDKYDDAYGGMEDDFM